MNQLFAQYEMYFDRLRDLEQDDLPRSLRLFNIRIRLALDIEVDFGGRISLTKTREVRDTYVLIVQLMELWNSYEALSHYVHEATNYLNAKVAKSRIYTQSFLKKVDSLPKLTARMETLRFEYEENNRFKRDFDTYIARMEVNERLSKTIKEDAASVLQHAKGSKEISGVEILSLIYAERNMYYHNGETAKMGMTYPNRQKLISWYKEDLLDTILKIAIAVVLEQVRSNVGR